MSRLRLLATDGSDVSGRAVEFAASNYDPEEDRVLVLSVADESQLVPYVMGDEAAYGGINLDEIRDRIEERAEDAVREAEGTLTAAGFDVEVRTVFGDPGEEICDTARSEDVDSVIMGRRGHTTVGELLLGSVSHYVVHHLKRPITLVPAGSEDGS